MAFNYMTAKERHWIGLYIGNFVSHKLIKNATVSVSEINKIDRIEAAKKWYEDESVWIQKEITKIRNINNVSMDKFISDVAVWIDERIPKAYKKWITGDHASGPASQNITIDEDGLTDYGLVYRYEENLIRSRKNQQDKSIYEEKPITEKQIDYLYFLALKNNYDKVAGKGIEGLTIKEASSIIDYFLDISGEEPECFSKVFIKMYN